MSQNSAAYNKYLETTVQTATPAQLLLMLWDGAIRYCKSGIEAIQTKDYELANRSLFRVQDIVREFMVTLDPKSPIADNLMPLYTYFIERLVEANAKKDAEPAQEVLGYLVDLKEAWVQAAKTVQSSGVKHG